MFLSSVNPLAINTFSQTNKWCCTSVPLYVFFNQPLSSILLQKWCLSFFLGGGLIRLTNAEVKTEKSSHALWGDWAWWDMRKCDSFIGVKVREDSLLREGHLFEFADLLLVGRKSKWAPHPGGKKRKTEKKIDSYKWPHPLKLNVPAPRWASPKFLHLFLSAADSLCPPNGVHHITNTWRSEQPNLSWGK